MFFLRSVKWVPSSEPKFLSKEIIKMDLTLSMIMKQVHTPWCLNCEALSKQVEKLSKHFKGFENLVFARIDASANEHPKLNVKNNLKTSKTCRYLSCDYYWRYI